MTTKAASVLSQITMLFTLRYHLEAMNHLTLCTYQKLAASTGEKEKGVPQLQLETNMA